MLPGEVPSDLDEDETHDHLAGRWSLLVDLRAEFQGALGAWLIAAFLFPGFLVGATIWGEHEDPGLALLVAGIIFIVCATIAAYSGWWFVWTARRERRTFELMQRRGEEEVAREDAERGRLDARAQKQDGSPPTRIGQMP